ncbi:MAG: His/Gly/Thr/Pro-type tRNA ligase C-terminal domain-containing protein, partial [Cetobacterium sp.]
TINDDVVPYAKELVSILKAEGIRVEIDTRAESIGYKIREANGKYKVPVQLIIGKNEVENREVNIRRIGSQNQESMSLENFVKMIKEEAAPKFNN